jgi:hypothetical protein
VSTASDIILKTRGASAVTYYGGYAMFLGAPSVRFECAHVESEKRNGRHRVTFGLYRYKDGSAIEMRWNENLGYRVRAI